MVITPGLIILLIVALWCGVAHLVGWGFYKWTGRRWVQVIAVAVVGLLPLWDLEPGLTEYHRFIRERGGTHVYRTVSADGYLVQGASCYACWNGLVHSPYEYIEARQTGGYGALGRLEQLSGYYEYRLAPIDDPRCEPFKTLPNPDKLRQYYGLGEQCVVATRRDEPISRYAEESSGGWKPVTTSRHVPPVLASCRRYVDLQAKELLAEKCRVRYVSWLAHWITIPEWVHNRDDENKPITLDVTEVIKPSSRATEQ